MIVSVRPLKSVFVSDMPIFVVGQRIYREMKLDLYTASMR